MFTKISYAATPGADMAADFVDKINQVILFPLIALLIAAAMLLFIYGSFLFIANAENSTARETGRKHIMWSIVGLFVMLSAYAILSVAANTFGLGDNLTCADDPSQPGCFEFTPTTLAP